MLPLRPHLLISFFLYFYTFTLLSSFAITSQLKAQQPDNSPPKRVRIIYIVSQDRVENKEYTAAIEYAVRDLQKWYGKQLNGPSFRFNDPVVEVFKSGRPATWFYANPNGANKDEWVLNNTLQEANRLCNAKFNDPDNIWIIYSDGPGDKGRGGSGVACLPEDDLLGLIGKHPTQKDKLRWIAGLGHEMGHAFGLPHPSDTEKHADAIMHLGIYGKYPDKTYLTEDDKKILRRSPFFFNEDDSPAFQLGVIRTTYQYPGGCFQQHEGNGPIYWSEKKTNGSESFIFEETNRDKTFITIVDSSRGISLRIPLTGGQSFFSNDQGKSWNPLYQVSGPNDKEKN
jgi:hypothetical protein